MTTNEEMVRELRRLLRELEVAPDSNGRYSFKVPPTMITTLERVPYAISPGHGEVVMYGIHFWSWTKDLSHEPVMYEVSDAQPS